MSRRTRSDSATVGIPEATIARLPLYLRALFALADRDIPSVSSEELAAAAGVNSAKLRKDLSHLGSYGTRGVGYDVDYLIYQVSRELGLTQDWPVIIVGAGNLGRALANYGGFATRGFRVAAMIDSDPLVIGTTIAGHRVYAADLIERVVAKYGVMIGAITVPGVAAQDICDRLVAAGVTSILNFAPVVLNVPDGVDVRKVDLSIELQILAFHAQRRSAVRPPHRADADIPRLEAHPNGSRDAMTGGAGPLRGRPSGNQHSASPGERPPGPPRSATPGERPPGTPRSATPGERPPGTPRSATPGERSAGTHRGAGLGERPAGTHRGAGPGDRPAGTHRSADPVVSAEVIGT